jgi:uncharacterized membrane protein YoaK (UPF0700 family)
MQPIVLLAYALTFTAGLINAVTVLGLGDIFASLMTGNVVFIGLSLGGAEDLSAWRSGLAIVAFLAGAAIGGRIAARHMKGSLRGWLLPVAAVEAALLVAAATVAHLYIGRSTEDTTAPAVLLVIALTSLAMGVRNSSVTRLDLPDLKTTVLTLTLTSLAADSRLGGDNNQDVVRRVLSVLLIIGGAAVGALLFLNFGIALPLVVVAATVLLATALYSLTGEAGRPRGELANE